MKIVVKNPSPIGPQLTKWGDYHFGQSLQHALEALGATVIQHYWPEWDKAEGEDAILVLRGKRRYLPSGDVPAFLWVMSHPASISAEEVKAYTTVFAASDTHRALLQEQTATPVELMRQCTDSDLFYTSPLPIEDDIRQRRDIIFVANSRGVNRDMMRWAEQANVYPALIGRHWKQVGLQHRVKQEYVENDALPQLYRQSRMTLNDHWGDMHYYGVINNRIFDSLACGLPIMSDTFPELRRLCGDSLLHVASGADYQAAIREYTFQYPSLVEKTRRLWEKIGHSYTFQARAEQIIATLERPPTPHAVVPRPHSEPLSGAAFLPRWVEGCCNKTSAHQFLHVNPTLDGIQALFSHDKLNYLSAGLGSGPWHVPLTLDCAHLAPERFDIVLIETLTPLETLEASEKNRFVKALVKRLRKGGQLLLPATLHAYLSLESTGMVLSKATDAYSVYVKKHDVE
ncbi:glycosyltransferase family 1 protein [Halomonas alkaliantarctica]|nr:glycosyltransferase family 1 protein [Halomonas alkaliantarctica]